MAWMKKNVEPPKIEIPEVKKVKYEFRQMPVEFRRVLVNTETNEEINVQDVLEELILERVNG